ncbi:MULTISPECIES: type III toxin-antitoxin system ToxN/AbiQ family toxin [Vagococcus]|uniref:Uncharacterized protein n=1 Tax=Vagococcus fluvialis bH819 TaxID=1255619 RepID=A0A1X6WRX5_9ENTE|nr:MULTISPECIES: type III toxin-antitoxin system ToxN/AbiQ family toxin [Vagococcus]SLM87103.1 hypothetical protein FM121_13475 [Vagococcus fluvialis bH819]HCM90617.1 hypothetical protein [Vagococcus sp.]
MSDIRNDKKLYVVSDGYIKKLQKEDYRVQNNYKGNRLYYKSKLTVPDNEDVNYYIPLSSAKESQKKINNQSVFKIYGSENDSEDFLGVLHVNNMIPVPDSKAKQWEPNNGNTDERYNMLIIKQSKFIFKNVDQIEKQAQLLFDSNNNNVDPEYFKKNKRNRSEIMLYKRIMPDLKKLEDVSIKENKKENRQDLEYDFN